MAKTKLFVTIIGVCLSSILYAHDQNTMLWLRFPVGSRANAMGASYVALAEDVTAIYWNPAGLGFTHYMEAAFTWEPWWYEGWNRFFGGFVVKVGNIGTIGVGYQRFDYGTNVIMDENGNIIEKFRDYMSTTTLLYSRPVLVNTSLGISVKTIEVPPTIRGRNGVAFDFGLLHRVLFSFTSPRINILSGGISVSNLGTEIEYFDGKHRSPEKILRIGIAYNVSSGYKVGKSALDIVQLILSSEYTSILNENGWATFGVGGEITLFDIGSIRGGRRFSLKKLREEAYRKDPCSWGIGIHFPLCELLHFPIDVGYDYGRHVGFWAVDDPCHTWFMRYVF